MEVRQLTVTKLTSATYLYIKSPRRERPRVTPLELTALTYFALCNEKVKKASFRLLKTAEQVLHVLYMYNNQHRQDICKL